MTILEPGTMMEAKWRIMVTIRQTLGMIPWIWATMEEEMQHTTIVMTLGMSDS